MLKVTASLVMGRLFGVKTVEKQGPRASALKFGRTNRMKCIVTGGAGFVGSTLAERLLLQGDHVVIVDSLTDYYDVDLKRERVSRLSEMGAEVLLKGVGDLDQDDLDGVSIIYHLAGQPGVRPSWGRSFDSYANENVLATQQLLELATKMPSLERVVYASSSSVYGNAPHYPTTELDLPAPMSPYGVTKLAAEHLCGLYARNFGVPTVSLRYFTVYGPGQRPDMAFHKFIKSALEGKPIGVYGDGEQIRDFTYVEDVVEANLAAAKGSLKPGSVYNVCGGGSVSVNDTIDLIGQALGKPITTEMLPEVPGDVRRTGGDSSALRRDSGWSPTVSISQGVEAEVEWVAKYYGF